MSAVSQRHPWGHRPSSTPATRGWSGARIGWLGSKTSRRAPRSALAVPILGVLPRSLGDSVSVSIRGGYPSDCLKGVHRNFPTSRRKRKTPLAAAGEKTLSCRSPDAGMERQWSATSLRYQGRWLCPSRAIPLRTGPGRRLADDRSTDHLMHAIVSSRRPALALQSPRISNTACRWSEPAPGSSPAWLDCHVARYGVSSQRSIAR